jgi:hypothetical protein
MAVIQIKKDPSPRELAWFGLLLLIFCGVIGALARWRFDSPGAGNVLWIVGVVLCAVYYALPFLRRWMFVGWMYIAFPIGWTISHILLLITYYLVFTPVGLIMRLTGRDPMNRRFEPDARTYWVEHNPGAEASRYFRQY